MVNLCFDSDGLLAKWGKSFEDTFLPGYFHTGVEPDLNAVTAVRSLNRVAEKNGFRVYIVSARYDDEESMDGKNRFEEDKKAFYRDNGLGDIPALFVPCGHSKREALSDFDSGDLNLLFDDHTPNLTDWEKGGPEFVGVKWLNGINGSGKSGFCGLTVAADRMDAQSIFVTILSIARHYSLSEAA